MREQIIAGTKVRITGGTDREGGGDGPLVVLLHGFGAPGDDLVPLYRQLDVPHEVRFAFPEALLDLGAEFGPQYSGARAWWMIDPMALASGLRTDRSHVVPDGLVEARQRVLDILSGLEVQLGAPRNRTILGGFSQGAMLSMDVAVRSETPFAGHALMSGTIIAADEWTPGLSKLARVPVMQSHGRADPLLSFEAAERLRNLLRDAGSDVRWVEFAGGHTITGSVLDALGKLVRDVAGAT
jgi:phospholipase/carboxylesterase